MLSWRHIPEDALHRAFRCLLHGSFDRVIWSGFFCADDQVDNGDVESGDSEGHAGQLPVEGRDDLSNGLMKI